MTMFPNQPFSAELFERLVKRVCDENYAPEFEEDCSDAIFTCKDAKDCFVLWIIDEHGGVVGERIFPKETFPDAQLAFLLGNWINENNIKPEEMAICQMLINECKREGITLKDVVAISVCTDNFKEDTTCTNASIADAEQ